MSENECGFSFQFELQWMLIHCDPKRAQRESCNELPATEVQYQGLDLLGVGCGLSFYSQEKKSRGSVGSSQSESADITEGNTSIVKLLWQ